MDEKNRKSRASSLAENISRSFEIMNDAKRRANKLEIENAEIRRKNIHLESKIRSLMNEMEEMKQKLEK